METDSSDEEEVVGWDGEVVKRKKRSKDGKRVCHPFDVTLQHVKNMYSL
jgi:hypothetical protein